MIARAEAILKDASLTPTKGRIAVLDVLMRVKGPVSIDVIEESVGSKANYVTLYRILRQLVQKGIVYQTDFRQGKAFFEYQTYHHHHITCTLCGMREEVASCISNATLKSAQGNTKKFRSITSHSLEFFGICTKCA